MTQRFLFIIGFCILLTSCSSTKKSFSINSNKKPSGISKIRYTKTNEIINYAKSYLGTPYKYGGLTKRGMDCSGLVYTAFNKGNIGLPRTSYEMSNRGKSIKLSQIKKGDLVFFKTSKSSQKVNHVGLVTKTDRGRIYFIHSSSSKGVMVSELSNPYWKKSYQHAKRIL